MLVPNVGLRMVRAPQTNTKTKKKSGSFVSLPASLKLPHWPDPTRIETQTGSLYVLWGLLCIQFAFVVWSSRVGVETGWKWYEIARFHFCFVFCLEVRTSVKLIFLALIIIAFCLSGSFQSKFQFSYLQYVILIFPKKNDVIFFINHFTDFFEMESCLDNHQCRFHHEKKKDFKGKESLILDNLLLIGIRCIHVYDHMSKLRRSGYDFANF